MVHGGILNLQLKSLNMVKKVRFLYDINILYIPHTDCLRVGDIGFIGYYAAPWERFIMFPTTTFLIWTSGIPIICAFLENFFEFYFIPAPYKPQTHFIRRNA